MRKLFRTIVALLVSILTVLLFTLNPVLGCTQNALSAAAFTISNIVPALNEIVTFEATASLSPKEKIISYSWDFNDGTQASGVQVTHAFATVDDFRVTLTVTDSHNLTRKVSRWVFVGRPQGWTEKTHHQSADGDYAVIFPRNKVLRMDIMISPEKFQIMEDDLANRNMMMNNTDPVYVPVTVKFNNYTWWNVGMRYKGQSTITQPKMSGKHKYPFHLNFDKFEADYPEIKNQRFYGFKELLCNSNWFDASFIRDVVCSDIFRAGGVPTARGSFCRMYIDTGSGPVYWGLYTIFEDHSDQMLKTQFANSNGNLYKPEGWTGADWQTYKQEAFIKKTNEAAADWSDALAAVTALNADRSDPAVWRAGLEKVFDVKSFLRWLAINTALVNWDSYGKMAQNYFLYQDLAHHGRLVWIPWDFNMALSTTFGIGGNFNPGTPPADWTPPSDWPAPPTGWVPPDPGDFANMTQPLSLSLGEVGAKWPLIRFLIDDPVYSSIYHREMRKALSGCFNEAAVAAKIRRLHELIRPYVVGTEGENSGYTFLTNGATEFDQALTDLLNHVSSRQTAVRDYLATVSLIPPEETDGSDQ